MIALARTSSAILNSSGEIGHLCLVLNLKEKAFMLLPLSMILAVGLKFMAFTLRHVLSMSNWWRIFIKNGCWIFFCIYLDDHLILLFHSINVMHWLIYVCWSSYPRDKSHLIMVNDPFNVLLNWYDSIVLRSFASILIRYIGLSFSFLVVSFSAFSIRILLALQSRFCSPLKTF